MFLKYRTKNLIFEKQWYVYWYNGLLFVLVLNVFCIATQLALNLLTVCSCYCRHPTPCRFQYHDSGSRATLKKIDYNALVNPKQ